MNNSAVCSPLLILKINQREVSICMFDMAQMFLPDANLTNDLGLGTAQGGPIAFAYPVAGSKRGFLKK